MEQSLPKQELRKMEQEKIRHAAERRHMVRRTLRWSAVAIVVALAVWGLYALIQTQPRVRPEDIISKNGIHWHPHLSIRIKGQEVTIPEHIGLGIPHQPLHTHDPDGIIHLEYERPGTIVTKDDTQLGKFFKIWGKRFDRECIFESCNGSEGTVKFRVNGKDNSEFENYPMKDKDRIEIVYE